MARIKKVNFTRANRNEGCTCDRCGQWLQNIWTVEFADGLTVHFGIECMEKMSKESRLNDYGRKELKKTLNHIEKIYKMMESEKALTEDSDIGYRNTQEDEYSFWYGRSWQEFHDWRVNEFWQERIKRAEKEIERFRKIEFEA